MPAYTLPESASIQLSSFFPSLLTTASSLAPPIPTLCFYPIDDSFITKRIPLSNNQHIRIGRKINEETAPSDRNGYFDAKVLSRQHAEVWEEGGKIFIKDVKSSNGTFINGERMSPEGTESEAFELRSGDIVQFGVDIISMDNISVVYHKVSARVVYEFNDQDVRNARGVEQHQQQYHHQGFMNTQEQDLLEWLFPIIKSMATRSDTTINEDDLDLLRKVLESPLDVDSLIDSILFLLQRRHPSISGLETTDRRVQMLLFKLIFKTDALPLMIDDVESEPNLYTSTEESGYIFKGQHKGQPVTLQLTYQVRHENNSHKKDYYQDIIAWQSLRHRYILPLLGIFEMESQFFLVSPLMINGTLTEWRRKTPDIAEIHKLMREVAEGVRYIHSEGIVHGDLRGENILLDSNFHCQITGFGLTQHSSATTSHFAAPELFSLRSEYGRPDLTEYHEIQGGKTMHTDVYAFGCLYYAIFFDAVPFQETENEQISQLVMNGKRPVRLDTPEIDDSIWNVIQNCWSHDPFERLTMEQITQTLTTIPVSLLLKVLSELRALGDFSVSEGTLLRHMHELLDLPEESIIQITSEETNVKVLLDFILHLLHQGSLTHCGIQDASRRARKLMLKLISTDALPESLFVTNVKTDLEPIGVGGFGRVFGGEYKGQQVALKMLDKVHRKKGSLGRDFCREALAWRSLSHRFILPLLGIFEHKSQLYLVSPLMNGTLSNWRKKREHPELELNRVMLEVAEGIQYIHSEGIVHGDLHGGNVLIDSDFHCQITDFGSTRHSESTVTQSTTALSLSFAAPELFGMCIKCGHFDCEGCYEGHDEHHRSKTMETDIYAFGCLYYATFFDTVPFDGTNDFQIIRFLTKGRRPPRLEDPKMADNTWDLIQDCWKSIPSERPTMEQIMNALAT